MPAKRAVVIDPAEVARIRAERLATDPLTYYQPGPTLQACRESPARFRLIRAANQVGKTTFMMAELAAMARGVHPYKPYCGPLSLLVMAPSRMQLSTVWGERLLKRSQLPGPAEGHPWIPSYLVTRTTWAYCPQGKYPGTIELKPHAGEKHGTKIFFALSGDVNAWKRLEGILLDYVVRDEMDGSEAVSDEIMPRLLRAQSNERKPWCGGYLWGFTATKVNDEAEEFERRARDGVPDHAAFYPQPDENPAISAEARTAMAGRMSKTAFAIRGTGDLKAADAMYIYRSFLRDDFIRDTPYTVGIDDNLWISYDPGWRHPCGILYAASNREQPDKLRVVGFDCFTHGTLSEHVDHMARFLQGRKPVAIVCDPAIMKTESTGVSCYSLFQNWLAHHKIWPINGAVLGRNRNEDGFPRVQQALRDGRVECCPQGPGICGEDGFVDQMKKYRWAITRLGTAAARTVHKRADEGPDCLKYLLSMFRPWKDYGANPTTTEVAAAEADEDEDPNVALWRKHMRASRAIWEREYQTGDDGHPGPVELTIDVG